MERRVAQAEPRVYHSLSNLIITNKHQRQNSDMLAVPKTTAVKQHDAADASSSSHNSNSSEFDADYAPRRAAGRHRDEPVTTPEGRKSGRRKIPSKRLAEIPTGPTQRRNLKPRVAKAAPVVEPPLIDRPRRGRPYGTKGKAPKAPKKVVIRTPSTPGPKPGQRAAMNRLKLQQQAAKVPPVKPIQTYARGPAQGSRGQTPRFVQVMSPTTPSNAAKGSKAAVNSGPSPSAVVSSIPTTPVPSNGTIAINPPSATVSQSVPTSMAAPIKTYSTGIGARKLTSNLPPGTEARVVSQNTPQGERLQLTAMPPRSSPVANLKNLGAGTRLTVSPQILNMPTTLANTPVLQFMRPTKVTDSVLKIAPKPVAFSTPMPEKAKDAVSRPAPNGMVTLLISPGPSTSSTTPAARTTTTVTSTSNSSRTNERFEIRNIKLERIASHQFVDTRKLTNGQHQTVTLKPSPFRPPNNTPRPFLSTEKLRLIKQEMGAVPQQHNLKFSPKVEHLLRNGGTLTRTDKPLSSASVLSGDFDDQISDCDGAIDEDVKAIMVPVNRELQKACLELQKKLEVEREKQQAQKLHFMKLVDTNKTKFWCVHCLKEAKYYCCWQTAYCSNPCQNQHWRIHKDICTRIKSQAAQDNLESTKAPGIQQDTVD